MTDHVADHGLLDHHESGGSVEHLDDPALDAMGLLPRDEVVRVAHGALHEFDVVAGAVEVVLEAVEIERLLWVHAADDALVLLQHLEHGHGVELYVRVDEQQMSRVLARHEAGHGGVSGARNQGVEGDVEELEAHVVLREQVLQRHDGLHVLDVHLADIARCGDEHLGALVVLRLLLVRRLAGFRLR
eukprot:9435940-Pyramimonas_sp.AAC.1